jgi:hypothetical protein
MGTAGRSDGFVATTGAGEKLVPELVPGTFGSSLPES